MAERGGEDAVHEVAQVGGRPLRMEQCLVEQLERRAVALAELLLARLSAISVSTSRCWAPSWRSRWRRRLVSSAVATTRARDAVSCARLSALAIAAAMSPANCCRRSSMPSGSGASPDVAVNMPQTSFSTETGTETDAVRQLRGELGVRLPRVVVDAHETPRPPDASGIVPSA